ncbi:MAG TPA: phosphate regulon sensor protein PhoR [Burkholderiaceae bacterium]
MSWLLNRALLAIVIALAGAGLGAVVGNLLGAPQLGPAVGASVAIAAWVMVDGVRALHLMNWLRGDLGREAPRDRGFWGEASYRIERALRQRDRAFAGEQERFAQFMSAIEASPNGVLLLDAGDQIQWLNAVAATRCASTSRARTSSPATTASG